MDDIPAAAAKGSAVSLACAVFLLVRIYKGRAGPTSVRAVAIFFIIPVFLTGATLRVRSVRNISSLKESLDNLISSTDCTFSGFISDISLDNDKTIYFIEDACVNSYTGSVKVTLKVSFEDEYRIGDYAEGTGKLRKPNPPANPGGFDEEAYYTVRGIDGLITATGMQTKEVYEEDVSVSLKRFVRNLRLDAIKGLRESLGPDEAAVLSAVLTGERGLIDDEIKESLATGGISHILAVSGLHISLIANGMYSLLMRITGRKKLNSVITIFFLLMYGIFAGMPVSAVRAIIMSSCMLLSRFFGKSYDMMSSLSLAGLFILFVYHVLLRGSGSGIRAGDLMRSKDRKHAFERCCNGLFYLSVPFARAYRNILLCFAVFGSHQYHCHPAHVASCTMRCNIDTRFPAFWRGSGEICGRDLPLYRKGDDISR